jgi:hypothetical protein
MNIIEAQVSQVKRHGDAYFAAPMRVLARYQDLYNTVLYDCLELGAEWREVRNAFAVAEWVTEEHVREYVLRHGRVVVDEWFGPVTHRSHVEPVEQSQP